MFGHDATSLHVKLIQFRKVQSRLTEIEEQADLRKLKSKKGKIIDSMINSMPKRRTALKAADHRAGMHKFNSYARSDNRRSW